MSIFFDTNDWQKALSAWWLKRNKYSSLKLNKFLFLYEATINSLGEKTNFSNLLGFKNGPVYEYIWNESQDVRKKIARIKDFQNDCENVYNNHINDVNEEVAERISFIVESLTENELSEITHEFNIWKNKEKEILNNPFLKLSKNDFNDNDKKLIKELYDLYPLELVKKSMIINFNKSEFYFIFPRDKYIEMFISGELHDFENKLKEIKYNKKVHNPIFVDIDEEGDIIFD
ncbi:type II toxin-antitoxin system antitoxin SocA domain-containing protein [Mycoplasma bradburyae]|uniref:Antitoxin SocA-like Panacea domain-containing protein n=1 Tax=Mycoplasma bradburyae TaxID=2963128 RepID=A0ABT5GAW2_9MOLU|nr:hypothetical protein [Mycoplasma bradburyae]MDC4181934.1 hypothetical protein [Mycoplasma bradburyae]UTS70359.1 hypothetical protein NMG68_01300 [Mycoplasma bradburyae]